MIPCRIFIFMYLAVEMFVFSFIKLFVWKKTHRPPKPIEKAVRSREVLIDKTEDDASADAAFPISKNGNRKQRTLSFDIAKRMIPAIIENSVTNAAIVIEMLADSLTEEVKQYFCSTILLQVLDFLFFIPIRIPVVIADNTEDKYKMIPSFIFALRPIPSAEITYPGLALLEMAKSLSHSSFDSSPRS